MTASGYVRQSAAQIVTGNTIQAADFNNEYNAIQNFADGTIGHDHSGGSGLGPKLSLLNAVTGILPSANGGTGVANTGIITIGGNLTISGAFTTALTVTGNTAVTLPTTGTLVNTAVTTLSSLVSIGTITTGVWNGTAIVDTYISSASNWNSKQAGSTTLSAFAAYNTNGLITQTAANTYTGRTITGTSAEIGVTNGDGVSGNPTLSLPTSLTFTGKTVTGGTFSGAAISSSTITGSSIGSSSPSTAQFTTLTSTGSTILAGSMTASTSGALTQGSGNWSIAASGLITTTSGISAGNGTVTLGTTGWISCTTLGVTSATPLPTAGIYTLGSIYANIAANGVNALQLRIQGTGPFNFLELGNFGPGFGNYITSLGNDTNIDQTFQTKGSGRFFFQTNNSVTQFSIQHTASATNSIQVTGSNGGAPSISTSGGDLALTSASGHVTVPTETSTDNSTRAASTAFVKANLVTGATAQSTPSNPASTTNATGVMMGLAGSITPTKSGKVLIIISGDASNATGGLGNQPKPTIRFGTSTAPTNGAALTGTAVGNTPVLTSGNNNFTQGFSCNAVVTGLVVGTPYWIDLALASSGGTSLVENLSISVVEL